jgi:CO/xanthine dehydrogenase Mo-binding subunit
LNIRVFGHRNRRIGAVMFAVGQFQLSCLRPWRAVCAVDCGAVVNPDTARAQIQSPIIFSITPVLYAALKEPT